MMNRRYFLLGSAALAAPQKSYPQSAIGVGMIGTGNRGSFVLPKKIGTAFITVRSAQLAALPPGVRVKPAQVVYMPRIIGLTQGEAAIVTEPGAHHYRFVGIELASTHGVRAYDVVALGTGWEASLAELPHDLIFDRCYVHSSGLNRARRGVALNSAETSIINSHISGFAGAGDETQAIAGWNGPGPFHLVNNYLEGAGEVVLIGGADPAVPNLVPSDIEIRRNYLRKPKEWMGRATIKGTLELKNARRVVIEGNLIESEILTTAMVLTVRNQGGKAPWSTIEDVEMIG